MRGGSGHAARQGAARDPRQLPRHSLFRPALSLDRAQGPHRGHLAQPAGGEPAAVAQIRAGARLGRRLVDQRPTRQPRRALRLRRVGGARCRGLELERRAALFQKGRARHGFRRAVARQGRPHPGPPDLSRHVERARQGGGQGVRRRRLLLCPGPERRVQGRLFSNYDLKPLRSPRLGGDRLSRSRHPAARQSDDLDPDRGPGAPVRGHPLRRGQGIGRRQGDRVPREFGRRRGRRLVGRDPFAGASAARRDRARRRSARSRHRGRFQCAGGRAAADGPPVDLGLVLHQARRRGSTT